MSCSVGDIRRKREGKIPISNVSVCLAALSSVVSIVCFLLVFSKNRLDMLAAGNTDTPDTYRVWADLGDLLFDLVTMGKQFGNLAKYSNVITYHLSPFEQKAFAGYFKHGAPNLWRRFKSKVFIVTPPFVIAYMVYSWGNKENRRLNRKQPGQFDNEKL